MLSSLKPHCAVLGLTPRRMRWALGSTEGALWYQHSCYNFKGIWYAHAGVEQVEC